MPRLSKVLLEAVTLMRRGAGRFLLLAVWAFVALVGKGRADIHPEWTQALAPFHIAGNLYYVGSADLASYLIVTPSGNILINSSLTSSPELIRASIEKLGFRFSDTRILLIGHAHYDHCAGSAEILRQTGAKYMVMDADVPVVESGGKVDFHYGSELDQRYSPAKVDRILHDGDEVLLGGAVLTAHKTAGHTRGTTTWTMDVTEAGKVLHVVIVGSPNVNSGYRLTGQHPSYPGIAADFAHGFAVLRSLPCDIFLGSHGAYFEMLAKLARLKAEGPGVFVDPVGYKSYIAEREATFNRELKRQTGGAIQEAH